MLQEAATGDPCEFCYGTGMEVVPGKGAKRCRCKTAADNERRCQRAQIPPLFSDSTLRSYQPVQGNGSQLRAFHTAYTLVREWPVVRKGILFQGPVGVGKTHLAVGILHGLLEKGANGLFYEFGRLLKEIQNSYNPISQSSELEIMSPALDTEVLVLDELGATKPTEWVLDTMLQIINTRYNNKRLTIVTTNYLDDKTDHAKETLAERIGERLRSRLYQMCITVYLEGEDYRKKL